MLYELIQRHAMVGVEDEQLRDEVCASFADSVWQRIIDFHDLAVGIVVFVVVERSRADEYCE